MQAARQIQGERCHLLIGIYEFFQILFVFKVAITHSHQLRTHIRHKNKKASEETRCIFHELCIAFCASTSLSRTPALSFAQKYVTQCFSKSYHMFSFLLNHVAVLRNKHFKRCILQLPKYIFDMSRADHSLSRPQHILRHQPVALQPLPSQATLVCVICIKLSTERNTEMNTEVSDTDHSNKCSYLWATSLPCSSFAFSSVLQWTLAQFQHKSGSPEQHHDSDFQEAGDRLNSLQLPARYRVSQQLHTVQIRTLSQLASI